MKKIAYFLSLGVLAGLTILSSCKKSSDPTPDSNPEARVITSTITTSNGGNSGLAIVVDTVSVKTGTVKLRLDVTSSSDIDYAYIMLSQDNGPLQPVVGLSSVTTSAGKTFTGGTDYSFTVPNKVQSFVLDVPVTIRTSSSAVTDVYYVWLSNGKGNFFQPTKNRVLGAATFTLRYSAAAPSVTFSTATLDLGSQSSTVNSLLVTSGQVAALGTSDYNDAPASSDLRLVTLTSGNKDNNSTSAFLYSPADVPVTGSVTGPDFTVPTGSNSTKIGAYTGSVSFDNITGANLQALSTPANTSTAITAGSVYVFQTATGKKGLIKVNSISAGTPVSGQTAARNANVTVKVLN